MKQMSFCVHSLRLEKNLKRNSIHEGDIVLFNTFLKYKIPLAPFENLLSLFFLLFFLATILEDRIPLLSVPKVEQGTVLETVGRPRKNQPGPGSLDFLLRMKSLENIYFAVSIKSSTLTDGPR